MKKISQFILLYIISVITILGVYFITNSSWQKNLETANIQVDGLEYLNEISHLSIAMTKCLSGISCNIDKKRLNIIYQEVTLHIDNIYKLQNKEKLFVNEDLNKQLELIRLFKVSEEESYQFLEAINHENYTIGDKSKLMFENDRELFFLSSLVTHYMPEYMISRLLSHAIIEEYSHKGKLSNKKKNIFLEQMKLASISEKEIRSIIKMIGVSKNSRKLKKSILQIHKELEVIQSYLPSIYKWENNKQEIEEYLLSSQKILDYSFVLKTQLYEISKISLDKKREELGQKILNTQLIFLLIILMFSLFAYLFYRAHSANIQKDKEIKSMNGVLDKFVAFSKTDKEGNFTYLSSALKELSGFSNDELLGKTASLFRHPDTKASIYVEMWNTILAKKTYSNILLNRKKDGSSYWAKIIITPEIDKNEMIIGFSAYIVDVTDNIALQERTSELLLVNKKLEELSVIDTLTQIYNRLKLDKVMKEHYKSFNRYKRAFSLIIIDIDNFKNVNDTYGHLVGDETLKSMVNIIKNNIRNTDIFGRWGGEEFMIICQESNSSSAKALGEKIRIAIENYTFDFIGKKTVSLGIAEIEESLSISELIKRSDDALYYAKEHGRNQTVRYSETGA